MLGDLAEGKKKKGCETHMVIENTVVRHPLLGLSVSTEYYVQYASPQLGI